jgi:hypothetical protein
MMRSRNTVKYTEKVSDSNRYAWLNLALIYFLYSAVPPPSPHDDKVWGGGGGHKGTQVKMSDPSPYLELGSDYQRPNCSALSWAPSYITKDPTALPSHELQVICITKDPNALSSHELQF